MKKGTRVKFLAKVNGKTQEIHGVVARGTAKGQHGKVTVDGDNDLIYTCIVHQLSLSSKALPNHLKPVTFKKGQEVTTNWKGEIRRGIVERGGSNRITVLLDNGTTELRGHVSLFKKAEPRPEFKDAPSAMDGYSIKKYKKIESMSEETECFTADIVTPLGAVICASNRGHGGSNEYFCKKGRLALDQFEKDAKSWAEQNGSPYKSEPEGQWVTWFQYRRPHHVSAKVDFAEEAKRYAEMTKNA